MNVTEPVTVVSGLPRSGTSLMMQMLAAGGMPVLTDNLRLPDPDNPRGYFELEAVKQTRTDASWLENAPGKAVKVVHLLLRDLPPRYSYRMILMKRPIEEVLASQRAMLDRQGKTGPSIAAGQLAQVFLAQLAEAEQWVRSQPNFRLLIVQHHDLLGDPLGQARAVGEFCGSLDVAAMAAVVDPKLYRQRLS